MKACSKKRCALSVLAIFVFTYAYEAFLHGYLLMGMYNETPALWRPASEMAQYAPWFLLRYALLAMVIACLYKKMGDCAPSTECTVDGKKPCPYQKSLCFGIKIGVLMGVIQASSYVYMPISGTLALAWFVGALVEGACIGLILAIINKKKDGASA